MALGTALSDAAVISTTGGVHDLSFNTAGIAVANEWTDNQDILYVCLMSYNDYANVAPIQDGDHTQILFRYSEYTGTGSDPKLNIANTDSSVATIYAGGSGDADDAQLSNVTFDASVSWDTIRGDVDTVGSTRTDSSTASSTGVYTINLSGRGGAVITDNRRSYFAFNGSGLNPAKTVDTCTFSVYADNYGHTNDDFGKIIAVQATTLAGSTADYGNCFVADAVIAAENATFFGTNF